MKRSGGAGRTGPHAWKHTRRVADQLALSSGAGPVGAAATSKGRGSPSRFPVSQGRVRCRPARSKQVAPDAQAKPREAETPTLCNHIHFKSPRPFQNFPRLSGAEISLPARLRETCLKLVPSNPGISKYFFRGLGPLMKPCKYILCHSCSLSKNPQAGHCLGSTGRPLCGGRWFFYHAPVVDLSPHQRPTGRQPQAVASPPQTQAAPRLLGGDLPRLEQPPER